MYLITFQPKNKVIKKILLYVDKIIINLSNNLSLLLIYLTNNLLIKS